MANWISPGLYLACQAGFNFSPYSSLDDFLSELGIEKDTSDGLELNKNHLNILGTLLRNGRLTIGDIYNRVWSTGEGDFSQDNFDQQDVNADIQFLTSLGLIKEGQGYYRVVLKPVLPSVDLSRVCQLVIVGSQVNMPGPMPVQETKEQPSSSQPGATNNKRHKPDSEHRSEKERSVESFDSVSIHAGFKRLKRRVKDNTNALDDLIDVVDRGMKRFDDQFTQLAQKVNRLDQKFDQLALKLDQFFTRRKGNHTESTQNSTPTRRFTLDGSSSFI